MSVAEDFRTYLKAQSTVTRIVGDKIMQAPAHAKVHPPFVVYRRRGRVEEPTLAGEVGFVETNLDVECRGRDLSEAETLADAVHDALNAYRGTWGSRTINGVFVLDQDDDYEFLPPFSDETEHVATAIVQVFSSE